MNQNRWKSPVTIGAILLQVVSLLVAMGVIDVAKSEVINAAIAALLQVAVAFGVLNNPTDSANF